MKPRTGERTVAVCDKKIREKAVDCEFCDNFEDIILKQLIITVNNEKTVQKCIRMQRYLSEFLQKADKEKNLYRCLA